MPTCSRSGSARPSGRAPTGPRTVPDPGLGVPPQAHGRTGDGRGFAAFANPELDPAGVGYNTNQARIAI
ncbi:hypothetical protein, partial [Streptomyces sp. NPDC048845]|uniref:hypothetical protein n=1 Tax=Streptomyces sp. NPDC048845 TaxID=3155390 RepID=UPI00341813EC